MPTPLDPAGRTGVCGPGGAAEFLGLRPADGTLSAAIAAVEWAATPLGPPESWPQSLRTAVRTMLGSRFSMWMAWGPELTFLCNEAYRRDTLGSKYPWALGRPAREVWAEIWDEIGPRIDSVIRTGEATWDEALQLYLRRSGFLEETYHTFSYSPLADDEDRTAGMLCVVSEETERVISARRMATLRDLGAAMAEAVLTPHEVLRTACDILSRNRADLPFAALYLRTGATDGDPVPGARLVGTAGLTAGCALAPARLRSDDPDAVWPLPGTGPTVVRIPEHITEVPPGAQPLPPYQVQVVPLASAPGARPEGWLVVGLNPCRPMNIAHTGFLDLVARQISAGFAAGTAFAYERARAEELAELDRAKTAFFTNVSHELRTPLTLMLGPLGDALADRDVPLPEPQRRRVDIAFHNAERLLGLVNTLLDLARLDSGRTEIRLVRTDLAQYTAELASLFDSVAADAGLKLKLLLTEAAEPVPMDRDIWAKIVLNLLSNAVKHTFSGGITVELRLDGPQHSRSLVLEVSDTGIGIEPAEQQRLFERFHRVEGAPSRSHEGSGIGLALVAESVRLLGGTVGVQSVPGQGSTFTVGIPVPDTPGPDTP
ncbi:MAG TPA: HAMP domain-containing sensor histidine kinase, partial [Sporichthya sp.]|nr:HAMP domain-containing sensor histidine kinase [Sporichthya sp.]